MPVAARYQSMLLDKAAKIGSLDLPAASKALAANDMEVIDKISNHILVIQESVRRMTEARKEANRIESEREKAVAYHDTVLPHFDTIRYHIDKLELMVDNEMWALPKYRELLFIR